MQALEKQRLSSARLQEMRRALQLSVPNFQHPDRPVSVQFYHEDAVSLHVPRFFPGADFRPPCLPNRPTLRFRGALEQNATRPQQSAAQQVQAQLRDKGGAMLIMPCGTGKTNVALAVACAMSGDVQTSLPGALNGLVNEYLGSARTLVLAHTNFLLDQWRERILQFVERIDGQPVQIGQLQRERCEVGDFVLVSMQSLLRHEDYPLTARTARLLIVDEAHHAAAQGYFHSVRRLQHDFSLALTATPSRTDGLSNVVQWLLGTPAFRHTMPQDARVQVNAITFSSGRQWIAHNKAGRILLAKVLTRLCQDPVRNACLLDIVRTMHRKFPQRKGLLLSHRLDHLRLLHVELGSEMSAIISGKINTQSPKRRKLEPLRFEKFITLATYQMFAEAVDFDGDFLVLAAPKSQVEQCTGRILRGRVGERPVICDLVDPFGCFAAWARRREAFYRKRGWEVLSFDAARLKNRAQ